MTMFDIFVLLGAYIGIFTLFLLIVAFMTVICVFGDMLIAKFFKKNNNENSGESE